MYLALLLTKGGPIGEINQISKSVPFFILGIRGDIRRAHIETNTKQHKTILLACLLASR